MHGKSSQKVWFDWDNPLFLLTYQENTCDRKEDLGGQGQNASLGRESRYWKCTADLCTGGGTHAVWLFEEQVS